MTIAGLLQAYRRVSCRVRWSFWLSVVAVAYSTAGAVAMTLDQPAETRSMWEKPEVLLSLAGILIGVGAFVNTVRALTESIKDEKEARQAFEKVAHLDFARKDVIGRELEAIHRELALLREAVQNTRPT